ncbi:MAG TPA: hypothetical protein ENN74_01340, partial [Firmicutes bacterium]|nr:hypothetical protein [Bacillota bacterium]
MARIYRGIRVVLVGAAIFLGVLAQKKLSAAQPAPDWAAAAEGFRLYGWACLCFVLGCLPGVRREELRPSAPHPLLGGAAALLALGLIGFGLWGLYRFNEYMLGFLPLFAGLALLGIAYTCLVENVIALRRAQLLK